VNLSVQSVVVASKDQVSCDLGGEAAILSIRNGVYYGLDPVGAQIWNMLQKPHRVAELREAVIQEYAVEPERCERDLIALLEKLLLEGLIEVKESGPENSSPETQPGPT
jgi:hypothetical protein